MIVFTLLSAAFAADPSPGQTDPSCDLTRCPQGHEARICSDDFEQRGDCIALEQEGWSRACMRENRDKAWTLVVCRAPPAQQPEPAPATCGCASGRVSPTPALLLAILAIPRATVRRRA
jgi:hypothetical protein